MPYTIPHKLNAIYIGHSIPKKLGIYSDHTGLEIENIIDVSDYYKIIDLTAMGGAMATNEQHMSILFQSVTNGNYDLVFLDMGCNDLAKGISPLALLANVVQFAEALVKRGYKVAILSVLPRSRKKYCFNDTSLFNKIQYYNYILKNHCRVESKIAFIPQNGFCKKPLKLTTMDGIHPFISPNSTYIRGLRRVFFKALSLFDHFN